MNLIGYRGNYPYVVFVDISDFKRLDSETISFEEDDVVYIYRKKGSDYVEMHDKAPIFTSYRFEEPDEEVDEYEDEDEYSEYQDDVEPEWQGEPCGHYQAGCGSSPYTSRYDYRDYSCFNTSCGGGYTRSYSCGFGSCGGGC